MYLIYITTKSGITYETLHDVDFIEFIDEFYKSFDENVAYRFTLSNKKYIYISMIAIESVEDGGEYYE